MPEPTRRAPYQPALFATRDMGRVVPIEAYKQRAAERSERARQAEAAAQHLVHRPAAGEQGHLQFDAAPVSAVRRQPAPDARYSDAPVAIPTHRMMAAFVDGLVVLAIAGIVCLTLAFGVGNGNLPGGKPLWWFAGMAVAVGLAYKFFWALAGTDSPGLRSSHLRLLHFDGREPNQRERCLRILWSLLSIMAGGLGLVWALVDEESLSWHDHSSKTFLTPYSTPRA
ncbi:MAG: RDD family protein [Bryobacterales bacterium]|nr:RDD family protein [Bryobacterales bacterium]